MVAVLGLKVQVAPAEFTVVQLGPVVAVKLPAELYMKVQVIDWPGASINLIFMFCNLVQLAGITVREHAPVAVLKQP